MALRLKNSSVDPDVVGEWTLPALTPFIHSRAFDTLKREMNRYLRREVDGRSFLITGHRGIGKTSLVLRAVQECGREALIDAQRGKSRRADRFQSPAQRPLLVKLHGPSLLVHDPDEPPPPETAALVVKIQRDAPEMPGAAPPVAVSATSHALIQITVALYRALSREASDAFRVHARVDERLQGGDFAELAGQLTLELDRAPGPATLRAYWSRLGKLRLGVFWPRQSHWRGADGSRGDQGVLEIVAIAAAAQAFQVCTGKVKDSESQTGAASEENTLKTAAGVNLADLTNKLIGLAVGAGVTGVMIVEKGADPVAALASGLAAGLVSALSLNLTSERNVKLNRAREYSFVPDRSEKALQRDFLVIIERLRNIGLAPVFMIDELDKIDDLHAVLSNFLNQLKQVTTDTGFFCFLADRR